MDWQITQYIRSTINSKKPNTQVLGLVVKVMSKKIIHQQQKHNDG